jgi:1-aminocyclopropane-1-carboxylate deaminase/D-cysteine desulfhydrase-like pyridoxal-dependent ACC family enzyme
MQMLFDISNADIEELHDDLFVQKQIKVSVLRLDKIHPVVSGNKLFKLHYFLEETLQSTHRTVLSFGGTYSNHLSATAYACKLLHLRSIGIVRGEQPTQLSPTLQQCLANGMKLKFISREEYDLKETAAFLQSLKTEFGEYVIVPEGGYHLMGARGAALIMDLISHKQYTHVCTASGTATTVAGLLMAAEPTQKIISVPVLKGIADTNERLKFLTGNAESFTNLQILSDYHFGGYAKKTDLLIDFMNQCWLKYNLPLDFVYTAKMMFAVIDSIKNNYFEKGSEIICLHTGGLQGNKSLPLNCLLY